MELKRRVDQIIKHGEACVSWTKEDGYSLSFKDEEVPEEVLVLIAFVDRYCNDDKFVEEMLDYFDTKCAGDKDV